MLPVGLAIEPVELVPARLVHQKYWAVTERAAVGQQSWAVLVNVAYLQPNVESGDAIELATEIVNVAKKIQNISIVFFIGTFFERQINCQYVYKYRRAVNEIMFFWSQIFSRKRLVFQFFFRKWLLHTAYMRKHDQKIIFSLAFQWQIYACEKCN